VLRVGQEETDAVRRVFESGKMFRYDIDGECGRFEQRYAELIGSRHVALSSSGSNALTAALAGLEIGPGDEVIVPAHTYMATANAVLAVGAIPIIVEIDESITLDPIALEQAIGPHTRAVMPVHMWGQLCNMDAIMALAAKHDLRVIEDACQAVCGFYKGRGAGSIGHAGAFSFNYFKNMTCGEGGATVTNDDHVFDRVRCMIDPCGFYWEGRPATFEPFVTSGARASEFEGAILNAQLDRIPALIDKLRAQKSRIVQATTDSGLTLSPRHDPEGECATALMFLLPTPNAAIAFQKTAGGGILAHTGRHNYTEWDPILSRQGGHHPALNPFTLPQNADCRMEYSKDMCPKSLEILARTVSIGMHPDHGDDDVDALIAKILAAAKQVLATA